MAIDLVEYQKLKAKVDHLRQQVAKAEGAVAQSMEMLDEDFECNTVKKAQALQRKLTKEAKETEQKLIKAANAFEAKYLEVLD